MILLLSLIFFSVITTGLYVYILEYLKDGILYYTMPIAFVLSFLGFVLILVLFLVICLIIRPKSRTKTTRFFSFFTTQVAVIVSKFSRVKVVVQNFDLLPKDGKFLFISNHQSLHDPIAVVGYFRKYKMSYIMKDSLMKIPFVGRWLEAGGFLPIDRTNDRNALKTIIKASKRLKDGYPIAVFPEGTRSGSRHIGEFRNGIFKIAQKAEAPIVVCLVDNFYLVKKRYPFRRTKALIRICEVIPHTEFKDLHTNEIGDRCKKILIDNQIEARVKYSWLK